MSWLQFANICNLVLSILLLLVAFKILCCAAQGPWKAATQEARDAIPATARGTWKKIHGLEVSIYASPVVFAFSLFLVIVFHKGWSPERSIALIRSGLFWQSSLEVISHQDLLEHGSVEGRNIY